MVRYRWWVLVAVGLAIAVLDQGSKFLAVKHLTPGLSQAHFSSDPYATGRVPIPTGIERDRALAELSLFDELTYFYRDIRDPCRQPGAFCAAKPVVTKVWAWRYVQNPGAAWGLLSKTSESIRVPFFMVVSIGAVLFIGFYVRRLEDHQSLLLISLALLFGGALGNFVDRLHLNYVIDFIDWYIVWNGRSHHWPTFNVADTAISCGVGLLLLDMVLHKEEQSGSDPAASPKVEETS